MRWYEAGRGGRRRSRTFTRKADARLFEAELMRRKALGEFAFIEASNKRLEDLASQWWEIYAKPNLAYNTLAGYAPALDKHVLPRLGRLKLRDVPLRCWLGFAPTSRRRAWEEAQSASRWSWSRPCSPAPRSGAG